MPMWFYAVQGLTIGLAFGVGYGAFGTVVSLIMICFASGILGFLTIFAAKEIQ